MVREDSDVEAEASVADEGHVWECSLQMQANQHPEWKSMVPQCLVLVINDNPYGLMVALSYT